MIYNLHTTSPMLQQQEERKVKILDTDYSKVDIDNMVDSLDIAKATKHKFKTTLNKYPTLFERGLGTLCMKPVEIELNEDTKPYASRFYNVPEAYKKMAKTEVHCLCTIGVLQKN